MDPDKDLLVLVEKPPKKTLADPNPSLSVHLLALRDPDAKPHPLAQHPVLYYKPRIWHRKYHFWIQVIGDVLAVMFMPEILQQDQSIADQLLDETVIWKWKTGELVTSIRCEPGYEAGSFSFLTNDIIVIPSTKDEKIPELRLYRLPTQKTPSEASSSSAKASTLLAIFHFPEFKDSVMACGIICRADPSPWVPPSRSPIHRNVRSSERDYDVPVWPAHGAAPFAPHPSSRLLVISLDIVTMGGWPGWIAQQVPWQQPMSRKHSIFTKGDVLLEAWRKGLDDRTAIGIDAVDSVVEIPWEVWGPAGTRMLSEATDPSAVCYVYGLRYIRLVAMGADEDRAVHIRVMDFNDREFDRSYHEDVVAQTAGAEERSGRRGAECGAPEEPEPALNGINENQAEPGEVSQELAEQLVIVDDDGDDNWVDEEEEEEEEGEDEEDEELEWEVQQETNLARSARRRRDAILGFGSLCIQGPEEKARCERMGIAYHESYLEDDYVFKYRITTSLPFRWSFKTAPEIQRWTSCMLDDEHIIGLKRTQRTSLSDIAVTVDILTL
ncbi:hypothetical protein FRC04_011827 [Tulasnella sp. 424]|nr:hypothetical protein FRC04_011827 [Tulasnella sp. 424]